MSLFVELKRRNVFRVGIAYVLMGWVLLQGADFVLDLVGAPDWVIRVFTLAVALGLPFALFFAWAFELTPEGIKRETEVDRSESIAPKTGRRLDFLIIGILVVALAWFAWDKFLDERESATAVTTASNERPADPTTASKTTRSVAVLPFVPLSSGPDDEYFADGLTEEILNSLAQLPELLVTARTSAFSFKGQDLPVQDIAKQLGVAHIVEGSVRRSGERLRITAQLIRAADGFHLWSENYDSTEADTIAVQEDVAEQIATALDVVLDEDRREAMRRAGLRDVTAFIAFQKGREAAMAAHEAVSPVQGLKTANRYFEQVMARVPDYGMAYQEHSDLYAHVMNDVATGDPIPGLTEDEIAASYELLLTDMQAAAEHASSFAEKSHAEFDLAVLRGDLRGIDSRMQTLLAEDDCDRPGWSDPIGTVFGYAQEYARRMAILHTCDPLWSGAWFSEARALLWAGDAQGAIELLQRAKTLVSHTWLTDAELFARLALGQFETAANLSATGYADDSFRVTGLMIVAAAQGDRSTAEMHMQTLRSMRQEMGDFLTLQFHAQVGDREKANELAARIDARAYGPMPLILVALWCTCGAPWDIEATPNFAAKLREGNLPWPPVSPVRFPLKDW